MTKATQDTAAPETKQLSLMDEGISQSDFEKIRRGKTVEVAVEKSAPAAKAQASESTDDESETSQTDGEDDESELTAKDTDGTKKPARGFKKRIDKLNGKLSAYERDLELLRRENEALKAPKTAPAEETQVATAAKGEPDPEDYESATEFYKAHARWVVQEETKAAKESERQEKLRAESETKKTAFFDKVDAFKKAHEDFEEVVADVDDIVMSPAIHDAILDSENPPELLYELCKNRDEYARMCAYSPFEAAKAVRELGRFEARLTKNESEIKSDKKQITKAPAPVAPVSTKSSVMKKSIHDQDIPFADYVKQRREQMKRR